MAIVRHQVRIHRHSYGYIQSIMTQLTPSRERLAGSAGIVYALTPALLANQQAAGLHRFQIGKCKLAAELNHLPSLELEALLPVHQHVSDHVALRTALIDSSVPIELIRKSLENTAETQLLPAPAPLRTLFEGRWCPNFTRLVQDGKDWFLSLGFSLSLKPGVAQRQLRIGLDLGLMPMTVAVTSTGQIYRFPGLNLNSRRALWRPGLLSPDAKTLLDDLVYAQGRSECEALLHFLITQAHTVHAERLRLSGFQSDFVPRARQRAILDYHHSWLPQYLWAAGIRLTRVPAQFTSQICSSCGALGIRNGKQFSCNACHLQMNADENASRNILCGA